MDEVTLATAKRDAQALFAAQDYARALRAFDRALAAAAADGDLRLSIAAVLSRVGMVDEAAEVYRAVAAHDTAAGHPLPAVAACHALRALERPASDLLGAIAGTYAAGSARLARYGVRPAPPDPAMRLHLPPDDPDEPLDTVAERALRRAMDMSGYTPVAADVHAIPLLSDLDADALLDVLRSLVLREVRDGHLITRQGEPGKALFFVATGQVRVFTTNAQGHERELARLHENSLFGEMALLSNQPRAASVAAAGDALILEIGREALDIITAARPIVRTVLDRFARERLVKNLIAHSPLFTPFTKQQQAELLRRFEGIDVDEGAEIIKQGEPGLGLYVVLSGTLEVAATGHDGARVSLGRLGTGEIFGEMSMLANQPTSATVRATSKSTLLFLARSYVERLSGAIPEVRSYFERVAARRREDNTLRLGLPALDADVYDATESAELLI